MLQVAALAALINDPIVAVEKDVKSQLIDTQHRYLKSNIWVKMAKREIVLASVRNLADFLTKNSRLFEASIHNKLAKQHLKMSYDKIVATLELNFILLGVISQ